MQSDLAQVGARLASVEKMLKDVGQRRADACLRKPARLVLRGRSPHCPPPSDVRNPGPMPRIVYFLISAGGLQGGQKMVVRHVETLRDLGFDAICYVPSQMKVPTWFSHRAPLAFSPPLRPDDIVVIPDDVADLTRWCAARNWRTVVFCQNLYYFAAKGLRDIELFPVDRFPPFIAVGPRMAANLARVYPKATIETVPCFADERMFRPGAAKTQRVAYAPRKRAVEAAAIQSLLPKFHPRHATLPWFAIQNMNETQAAAGFAGSTLCLSLNHLEGVGMTTLEAMASGCVCAGFTGVGGDDYATPDNGFWVANEYCEAATDALALAADLILTRGPALQARLEAGFETARRWSHAAFRERLEETWMRLAPEARLSAGPLDPA